MKIMIIGSTGLIGRQLTKFLHNQGHSLVLAVRTYKGLRPAVEEAPQIYFDYLQSETQWCDFQANLVNVELVINAAGVYDESSKGTFEQIHQQGPIRLFLLCQQYNVAVIQISAMGANSKDVTTPFIASKRLADTALANLDIDRAILYPGIVMAKGGESYMQLLRLSKLPLIPLLWPKNWLLPVTRMSDIELEVEHIVQRLFDKKGRNMPPFFVSSLVQQSPQTTQFVLDKLRQKNNLPAGLFISMPPWFTDALFCLWPWFRIGKFNKQSWELLKDKALGLSTKVESITEERQPKSLKHDYEYRQELKPVMPFISLFNFVLAFIWLISGFSSLINYELSLSLLNELKLALPPLFDQLFIIGGASLDIGIGLLILVTPKSRMVLKLQIMIMFIYSAILSYFNPVIWLHPFAPLAKNLAVLALCYYCLISSSQADDNNYDKTNTK